MVETQATRAESSHGLYSSAEHTDCSVGMYFINAEHPLHAQIALTLLELK